MILTEYDQWINWKKPDKRPIGSIHKVRLPFQQAIKNFMENKADGIGFVFTVEDDFVAIDLDGCVDERGKISNEALEIIGRFNSYTELSPSGTGIHIFCRGVTPKPGRRKGWIEVYSSGRFMTVTLNSLGDEDVVNAQEAIEWLWKKMR